MGCCLESRSSRIGLWAMCAQCRGFFLQRFGSLHARRKQAEPHGRVVPVRPGSDIADVYVNGTANSRTCAWCTDAIVDKACLELLQNQQVRRMTVAGLERLVSGGTQVRYKVHGVPIFCKYCSTAPPITTRKRWSYWLSGDHAGAR